MVAETTWDYTIQDFSPLLIYGGNTTVAPNLNSYWTQSCPILPSGPLSNDLCDVSSTHSTNRTGATVTLPFYGQAYQFIGGISGDLTYNVIVDGKSSKGSVNGNLLASGNLTQGYHNITIETNSVQAGLLSLEGVVITVGTGLSGADVTRTIVQDTDLGVIYAGAWSVAQFDGWNIQHTSTNTSWHQLNLNNTGSYSYTFQGSAIFAHIFSWSFFPTIYRASVDGSGLQTYAANSSLPNSSPGRVFYNGVGFMAANLTNSSHILNVDNANGMGTIGMDFLEVISVSGGVPLAAASAAAAGGSKHNNVGKIVGPVVGIVGFLLLALGAFLVYRRRKGTKETQPEEVIAEPFYVPHAQPAPEKGGALVPNRFNSSKSVTTDPSTPGLGYVGRLGSSDGSSVSRPPEKSQYVPTSAASPAPDEMTQEERIRQLQTELARARGQGSSDEIMGIRRDLQALLELVGSNHGGTVVNVINQAPPPQYE